MKYELGFNRDQYAPIFFLIPGIPRNMSFSVVQEAFLSVEGIVAVHNLRIWGLTTDKTALSAHLAISKSTKRATLP